MSRVLADLIVLTVGHSNQAKRMNRRVGAALIGRSLCRPDRTGECFGVRSNSAAAQRESMGALMATPLHRMPLFATTTPRGGSIVADGRRRDRWRNSRSPEMKRPDAAQETQRRQCSDSESTAAEAAAEESAAKRTVDCDATRCATYAAVQHGSKSALLIVRCSSTAAVHRTFVR